MDGQSRILLTFFMNAKCLIVLVFLVGWGFQSLAEVVDDSVRNPSDEVSASDDQRLDVIRSLSLDEILNTNLRSVDKMDQDLFTAPAAAFVISSDDIRRSGARSIPEALRMAPGINVSQMDSSTWAVASRGFNNRYTDRLLVLVDGRTVFSQVTGGVYWDSLDYVLADIDRIEVVRGSGGAIWGANAVNGVINIITKDAAQTEGAYVLGGGGDEERGYGVFRMGTPLGETGSLRGYVKYRDLASRPDSIDGWNAGQAGFRADWELESSRLSVHGDIYRARLRHASIFPDFVIDQFVLQSESYEATGGNFFVRLDHEFSEDSNAYFQAYYDRSARSEITYSDFNIDTFDLEYQHRLRLGSANVFTFGLGYRSLWTLFDNQNPNFIEYVPEKNRWEVFSGFVQDEISILPDQLKLLLGTKLERNTPTEFEVQPSVRLAYTPNSINTVWASVSRAVDVPGLNDTNIRRVALSVIPGPVPTYIVGSGNPAAESEEAVSYELGYRVQPTSRFALDVAASYTRHSNLGFGVLDNPPVFNPIPPGGQAELRISGLQGGEGISYGGEISAEYRPTDWWRLVAAYSVLRIELGNIPNALVSEGQDPRHQASLRSSFDLSDEVELDLWGRFVDALPDLGVESYFDLDLRLAWKATDRLELSVVGQNLLESQRMEWGDNGRGTNLIVPTPVVRGAYAQVSYSF